VDNLWAPRKEEFFGPERKTRRIKRGNDKQKIRKFGKRQVSLLEFASTHGIFEDKTSL